MNYDEFPKNLGKASWIYDEELNMHVPCCTVLTVKSKWISHAVVEIRPQPCGNGPLVGDQIESGDCGEHGEKETSSFQERFRRNPPGFDNSDLLS